MNESSLLLNIRRFTYPSLWVWAKSLKESGRTRIRRKLGKRKIYLYSFGGCGTKTLFHFLERNVEVNSALDVHEGEVAHINHNDRVVYLYGNPMEAVLSFYNREKKEGCFCRRHAEHLGVFKEPPETLEDYIAAGQDFFGLEEHFDRFTEPAKHEKLLINYAHLWSSLGDVLDYLNLAEKQAEFPAYSYRVSKLELLDSNQRNRLESIHASLLRKIERLEPILILPEK